MRHSRCGAERRPGEATAQPSSATSRTGRVEGLTVLGSSEAHLLLPGTGRNLPFLCSRGGGERCRSTLVWMAHPIWAEYEGASFENGISFCFFLLLPCRLFSDIRNKLCSLFPREKENRLWQLFISPRSRSAPRRLHVQLENERVNKPLPASDQPQRSPASLDVFSRNSVYIWKGNF